MVDGERWPRKKTSSQLREQLKQAIARLSQMNIVPPSSEAEVLTMDATQLKEKYTERYRAYLKLLRSQKGGQTLGATDLSQMRDWLDAFNRLDKYVSAHKSDAVEKTLYDKQLTVFEDIGRVLEQGIKEGYVKLPTGSGKTVLFSKFAEVFGRKTLIVVPTRLLVNQTIEKLNTFTSAKAGTYYSEGKDLGQNITVTTYQSLIQGIRKGTINPHAYHALILDEFQHAEGDKTREAIKRFECIKLGFSATPGQAALKMKEIHAMSISEAVNEGMLCGFTSMVANTTTDISNVRVVGGEKYDTEQLERAVNNHARNLSAVQLYEHMFLGNSAVAYCAGVNHAHDLARLFNEHNIVAATISGKTSSDERKTILNRFQAGEVKVLCNARVLIEGFDEPRASVALNLQPTLSRIVAEQRAGRVLRVNEVDTNKHAYVVDFIDQNSNTPPITFSEVAGTSNIIPESRTNNTSGGSQGAAIKLEPHVEITGLEIVTNTEHLLQIASDAQNIRERRRLRGWTLLELKNDLLGRKITFSDQYIDQMNENRWPTPSELRKLFPETEWHRLLGLESRKRWTLWEVRNNVREKNITSVRDYIENAEKYNWPNIQTLSRLEGYFGPDTLFGTDWQKLYRVLRVDVRSKNIKSYPQYLAVRKKNRWPSDSTLSKIQEFQTERWDGFFGRESRKEWTYYSLKVDVREKGIKSSKTYEDFQVDNQWPPGSVLRNMPEFQAEGSTSQERWDNFLGRESFSYQRFKDDVRSKKIKSSNTYVDNRKAYGWPSRETLVKMPEFQAEGDTSEQRWDNFLGRERIFFNYQELKLDVRAKKIKSSHEYENAQKENRWPTRPFLVETPEFQAEGDTSEQRWDNFLGREARKEWAYKDLKADVQSKGITMQPEYVEKSAQNNWPYVSRLRKMSEFVAEGSTPDERWDRFLGRVRKTYLELKTEVQSKNINSTGEYGATRKEHGWPVASALKKITEFQAEGKSSKERWDRFFGRETRKEWKYEDLKADIRAKGVTSTTTYPSEQEKNEWPSYHMLRKMPEFLAEGDTQEERWAALFGKEVRKEWTYETLKADVRNKTVRSAAHYAELRKANQWPVYQVLTKMPGFLSAGASNKERWDAFLGREPKK